MPTAARLRTLLQRHLAWLVCLALLLPMAQAAATWHLLSHAGRDAIHDASGGEARGTPSAHKAPCELCAGRGADSRRRPARHAAGAAALGGPARCTALAPSTASGWRCRRGLTKAARPRFPCTELPLPRRGRSASLRARLFVCLEGYFHAQTVAGEPCACFGSALGRAGRIGVRDQRAAPGNRGHARSLRGPPAGPGAARQGGRGRRHPPGRGAGRAGRGGGSQLHRRRRRRRQHRPPWRRRPAAIPSTHRCR